MHERGMWAVQNGNIIFKSKSCQVAKVSNPAMIIDMVAGTLHKFGERDWILSHYKHLASTYGEDLFSLVNFSDEWANDDIVTIANFACNAHDADRIMRLFATETPEELIQDFLCDLRKQGF